MDTLEPLIDIDPQERADMDEVMQHFLHRTPLDPEVSRRVEERARLVREEFRRVHGDNVDIDQLFRDDDDDA